MRSSSSYSVTDLLARWSGGDAVARDALVPLVYNELRRIARKCLAGQRSGHTLQPTALVHEAYLRMVNRGSTPWRSRTHFFAVAAQMMSSPQRLRKRLSGDLDNIVLMPLRKEPSRRYASVEQLSEDLRRHLDHIPVLARKDTLRYRASKFVSRHRAGVMASAAAVLALLGALTITLHEAHKQLREARSWYQKSLRTWQQDPNHSSLQPSSGNGAEQSAKQLAKCEAALAKLSPESSKSVAHNSVETKP